MKIIKPCNIIFANDKVEKEFLDLDENDEIKKYIRRAIDDIKKTLISLPHTKVCGL